MLGVRITRSQPGESDTFNVITFNECNPRWDETCVSSKVQSAMAGVPEERAFGLGHAGRAAMRQWWATADCYVYRKYVSW